MDPWVQKLRRVSRTETRKIRIDGGSESSLRLVECGPYNLLGLVKKILQWNKYIEETGFTRYTYKLRGPYLRSEESDHKFQELLEYC